jgi:hypothetical protein
MCLVTIFLATAPKAQHMKEKFDNLDFIKIKIFCCGKRMKRQLQSMRKYLQKT